MSDADSEAICNEKNISERSETIKTYEQAKPEKQTIGNLKLQQLNTKENIEPIQQSENQLSVVIVPQIETSFGPEECEKKQNFGKKVEVVHCFLTLLCFIFGFVFFAFWICPYFYAEYTNSRIIKIIGNISFILLVSGVFLLLVISIVFLIGLFVELIFFC